MTSVLAGSSLLGSSSAWKNTAPKSKSSPKSGRSSHNASSRSSSSPSTHSHSINDTLRPVSTGFGSLSSTSLSGSSSQSQPFISLPPPPRAVPIAALPHSDSADSNSASTLSSSRTTAARTQDSINFLPSSSSVILLPPPGALRRPVTPREGDGDELESEHPAKGLRGDATPLEAEDLINDLRSPSLDHSSSRPADKPLSSEKDAHVLGTGDSNSNSNTSLMLPEVFHQALSRFKQDADKLAKQDETRSSLPTAAQHTMMTLEQMASKFGGRDLTQSEQYSLLMSIAHLLSSFDCEGAQIMSKALVTMVPAVYTQFAPYGYKPTYIFAFVQKLLAEIRYQKEVAMRAGIIDVYCNACGTQVPDVHYHCDVCADFNLCHACYEGNKHPDHKVMPRSSKPSDSNAAPRSASSTSRPTTKRPRSASSRKSSSSLNKKPRTKPNAKSGSASKI